MATQIKTNKATLQQAIDMVYHSLNSRHGSVSAKEKEYALFSMKRNGLALIKLIEQPMNAQAKKLITTAELAIDRSTQIIQAYHVN